MPTRRAGTRPQSPKRSAPKAFAKSSTPSATTPANESTAARDSSPGETAQKESFADQAVRFVSEYATWIISVLAVGFVGSLLYLFVGGSKKQDEATAGTARDAFRYSAPETRSKTPRADVVEIVLNDEEDEGPRRVMIDPETGKPKGLPARDESEYALVVDEEELNLPHGHIPESEHLPEMSVEPVEGSADRSSESAEGAAGERREHFEKCVEDKDFDRAYEIYCQRLQGGKGGQYNPQVERVMGKHFLSQGELEKATFVLENHVATQPENEIDSEAYFDLAYIHFKKNLITKCRDYFRIYAEKAGDPELTDRAQKLIKRLERVQNLN